MKRRIAATVLVLTLAALAVSSALAAGGKGSQTLTATCSTGVVTVHASSGQSAWINNTHWVVLRFTGTFTPAGGGTPQTFTKVYGHKTGLMRRTIDHCSGSQTDPSGNTFAFMATVAKTTR